MLAHHVFLEVGALVQHALRVAVQLLHGDGQVRAGNLDAEVNLQQQRGGGSSKSESGASRTVGTALRTYSRFVELATVAPLSSNSLYARSGL